MPPQIIVAFTDVKVMERDHKKPRMDGSVMKWNRAINTRVGIKPLVVKEVLSIRALRTLKVILESNPDLDEFRGKPEVVKKLGNYWSVMNRCNGEREVTFSQKSLLGYMPSEYKGLTKLGRAYTSSVLVQFPKRILHTMLASTHLDVDIVSSFQTMLWHLFKHKSIPFIEMYVTDRPGLMEEYEEDGLQAKMVKKMVCATLSSFPTIPQAYGLDIVKDAEMIMKFQRHPMTSKLMEDLNTMATELEILYPEFFRGVVHYYKSIGKASVCLGQALTLLAGDIEFMVMRKVMDFMFPEDRIKKDIVWKYDGMLVPLTYASDPEQLIKDIEEFIMDEFGFGVKFKATRLDETPIIAVSIPPGELILSPYDTWKKTFEMSYGKTLNPPSYFRYDEDGSIQTGLSESDFKLLTMEQPKEFIKLWKEDPCKRLYTKIVRLPPPLPCDDFMLNLWNGLAAQHLPENLEPISIEPYLDHVHLLMGENKEYADYFHKLIARKVQYPGIKWEVMVYIQSIQGVGKDVMYGFLKSILGSENTIDRSGFDKIMGFNSFHLEGRLLVCITESDHDTFRPNASAIRDLVTNSLVTIEKKHVSTKTVINTADFIVFTNKFFSLDVTSDDRRIFAVQACGDKANRAEYFDPLRAWMGKLESIRAVYDYYMEMDVEDFVPSRSRISTDVMSTMISRGTSFFDSVLLNQFEVWYSTAERGYYEDHYKFIGDNFVGHDHILRVSSEKVIGFFHDYCKENTKFAKEPSLASSTRSYQTMSAETMARMQRVKGNEEYGMMRKTMNNRRFVLFNVKVVRKYLKQFREEG